MSFEKENIVNRTLHAVNAPIIFGKSTSIVMSMDLEKDSIVSVQLNIIMKNIDILKDLIKRLQRISRIKSD